jgi:pimeloyl-ACP methyl ester carboxylesterase
MAIINSFLEDGMTEFLDINGGRIAYDVTGEGPLIVLSHGIGDRRQVFRFLAPELTRAGFRVAAADMRGHGRDARRTRGRRADQGKRALSARGPRR